MRGGPAIIAVAVIVLAVLLGALLTGCAAMIPNPPAAPAINCPPLVAYSSLEQSVLASELPKDGEESVIQLEDYIKLREQCRAPALP